MFKPLKTGVRFMRHAVIVLLAVSCFSVFARTQTADELIAKNIQAKGGIDKIKAIKSVRITEKFDGGGGFTAKASQINSRPNLVRENFALQGMTAVQAYDGSTGWQIQPFGGHKDPELMGENDCATFFWMQTSTVRSSTTKTRATRSNIWATTSWMATMRCA